MIRTPPPRAVVFDLDGTLIDSMPLVIEAVAHAIAPFGARSPHEIFARLGGPPERFLGLLIGEMKHVPVAVGRMHLFLRDNAHLIRVFDGAVALLESLRGAQVHVALWTGRDRASTEVLLGRHALGPYFSTVVCGDDLPSHKPDPAGLREIMRRLEVAPGETLFVGDADVDVLGGQGCGVDTLLIRHDREIESHITAKSWRTVRAPENAFQLVLQSLQSAA